MKVWRFEWASLDLALMAGVFALVGLTYLMSRVAGWLGQ